MAVSFPGGRVRELGVLPVGPVAGVDSPGVQLGWSRPCRGATRTSLMALSWRGCFCLVQQALWPLLWWLCSKTRSLCRLAQLAHGPRWLPRALGRRCSAVLVMAGPAQVVPQVPSYSRTLVLGASALEAWGVSPGSSSCLTSAQSAGRYPGQERLTLL